MLGWLSKWWKALVSAAYTLFQGLVTLIDWGARSEFIHTHSQPGSAGRAAMEVFLTPSPALIWGVIFGGLLLIYWDIRRHRIAVSAQPLETPSISPVAGAKDERAPLGMPRVPLRWAHDYLVNEVQLGSRGSKEILDALRQAARDGDIAIYGRPGSTALAPDQFYKPREQILSSHWRDFGFDDLRCAHMEDPRNCRTKPDDTRGYRFNEAYVDMEVNEEEIRKRWPAQLSARFEEVPTNFGPLETRYFRLRVRNDTGRTHRGCRGFVTSIQRVDGVGAKLPTTYSETLPLTWATRQQPLPLAIDLLNGTHQSIDVFFVVSNNSVGFAVQDIAHQPTGVGIFSTHGRFLITVLLQSEEGTPQNIAIEFVWTGNWKTAQVGPG